MFSSLPFPGGGSARSNTISHMTTDEIRRGLARDTILSALNGNGTNGAGAKRASTGRTDPDQPVHHEKPKLVMRHRSFRVPGAVTR